MMTGGSNTSPLSTGNQPWLMSTMIIIIGLFYLAILCFRWSYASVLDTQIHYHLDAANAKANSRNVKHWLQARDYLEQILNLRPQHPLYQETAERFYQTLDTLETDAPVIVNELGWKQNEQQALQYARLSLQSMPSWPYLWKQLTLSKVTLGQIDRELSGAYAKARELGPWEKNLQFDLAAIALENWDNLDIDTRQYSLKAIERILTIVPDRPEAKLVNNHVKMADTCILLKAEPADEYPMLNKACQSRSGFGWK